MEESGIENRFHNEHRGNVIKSRRLKSDLTIDQLAVESGISRQYIKKIEDRKANPSSEIFDRLMCAFRHLEGERNLTLIVDYVRIRFETTNVVPIIEDLLGIEMLYMQSKGRGFYSYENMYVHGDISVMYSEDIKKGVLLELKGKGCRQYEGYLHAQRRNWQVFLKQALDEGGIIKRWDIAINDIHGILDIPELSSKCQGEEKTTVFKSFIDYRSGKMMKERDQHKKEMGYTLYIGSMSSNVYFCVYEKDYEQYIKYDIPIEDAEIKNRFEIRLKEEHAEKALLDYLSHGDIGSTAFGIINRYITFLKEKKGKPKDKWDIDGRWKLFIGERNQKLKLTEKPEPYTYEKTINWLRKQVAPSLKIVDKLDKIQGTNMLGDIIKEAHMKEYHQKILEQQVIPITEMLSNGQWVK